jgi:hypothetical protein
METKWWGETPCEAHYGNGSKCREVARYEGNVCGIHSKKETRKELPKNPNAKEKRQREVAEVMERAKKRVDEGKSGLVTATKMKMMRAPVPKPGFVPIFPNNTHGHGFGFGSGDFSSLSPMRLGPVANEAREAGEDCDPSGVPIAPTALNIENYHQFSKVFPQEMDPNTPCNCSLATVRGIAHNKPLPIFYETRAKAYADPIPHRHKFDSKDIKKANKNYVTGNAINTPMYSEQNGEHYSYVESRYFYCTQMEILATKTAAFQKLANMYDSGYALELFGYDAYEPTGTDADSLYVHYCDPKRPFGHEMVILALLALKDTPDLYPWRRYARECDQSIAYHRK